LLVSPKVVGAGGFALGGVVSLSPTPKAGLICLYFPRWDDAFLAVYNRELQSGAVGPFFLRPRLFLHLFRCYHSPLGVLGRAWVSLNTPDEQEVRDMRCVPCGACALGLLMVGLVPMVSLVLVALLVLLLLLVGLVPMALLMLIALLVLLLMLVGLLALLLMPMLLLMLVGLLVLRPVF
jgi:hypothetical protein